MRAEINHSLDVIDAMLEPSAGSDSIYPNGSQDPELRADLKYNIEKVQDAYMELIQQALRLLMSNRTDESHQLLQLERQNLASTFERIGTLIEDVSEADEPLIKSAIEYLFTRARLVDELKMFPAFGMELLDRLTLDESIDATIDYMEAVMTGKKNLFSRVVDALTELQTNEGP
tara:strand:- start:6044 stop:6565 length:522 start_codon:yes stop_codon:yes gene_type:complete